MEEYQELIRMPVEKAAMLGYNVRVVKRRGVDLASTCEYVANRINVAIDDRAMISEVISLG